MPDLNDLTTEVAHRARDAAYMVVGLGVLGFQRAQVQRRQVQRRLSGEIDLDQRLNGIRTAVTTGVLQIDELVEGAVQMVETTLHPLEEQLPPVAREMAQRLHDQAREIGDQVKHLVTPRS
ncbi:MAG: hypothetical protein ACRDYZ_11020 [Acidimicrobiales bacterium]